MIRSILLVLSCAAASPATASPLPGTASPVVTARLVEDRRVARAPDPQRARKPARRATRKRTRSRPAPRPPSSTAPTSAAALTTDLENMLASRVRGGRWGAMVVSLTRGDTLLAVNSSDLMLPASTFKLFTTALALERFGPDYQFHTAVLRDGELDASGTLHGNLYLRGDGDPGLSNRYLPGDAGAPMSLLAKQVRAAGVKRITGDVVGDATNFEDRRIPEGWLPRYLSASYAARVSALSINENVAYVAITPGTPGGPAKVTWEPSSSGTPLVSEVRTTSGSSGAGLSVRRSSSDGSVTVRGWIGSRATTRRYGFVIEDPARFTTGALRDALAAEGVEINGGVRTAPTPSGAQPVTALPSPPLAQLISAMNRESINIFAELLFRNAARGNSGEVVGSASAGNALLKRFMSQRLGGDPGSVYAADGSGLSVLDRVTPRAMIQLLSYSHRASWGPAFHASLPVAGESELLRNRMRGTSAQGNLHAKTGTTNAVIGLAGYVTARNGEILAFDFMYNGLDRFTAKQTTDQMGATMAAFSRP